MTHLNLNLVLYLLDMIQEIMLVEVMDVCQSGFDWLPSGI